MPVTLADRQAAYAAAEQRAETAAAAYLDARAAGRMTEAVTAEMDAAEAGLRRAKRRLEDTERRLARSA